MSGEKEEKIYGHLEGANCQTVLPQRMTQREAAVQAVRAVGLHQIREVPREVFGIHADWADMFARRLAQLQKALL